LDECFPYFVRESLISDLIVSYFQNEKQPLRVYIQQVFLAAEFLKNNASEQQLVDRTVMNFHPIILAHAALLDTPCSLKNLYRVVGLIEEKFIGMVGFYARLIPDYSSKAVVLHGLKRKGVQFVWHSEHQGAFESLKKALCEAPVLQIPDFGKEFVLVTDASDLAVPGVLHQRVDGELAPIS